MDTSARDCLVLFDTSIGGRLESGWAAGVLHQRTRTIKAGPMVYVECYPVWDTRRALAARKEAKKEAHAKAQAKLDAKNREKKVEYLTNNNFGAGDIILTAEYPLNQQPGSAEQAKRDIVNFLRRVKDAREKKGLPPIRYIYVTEWTQSEKYGIRWHHHVIVSGDGMTREEAEAKWTDKHKGFCNSRRAQPNERHLSGFARYLTQNKLDRADRNPQGKAKGRTWGHSRGLKLPAESVADKKISIRKVGRVAETVEDFSRAKEIFERLYPGCELLEVSAKRSEWAAGVYVRALLRRTDEKPEKKRRNERGDQQGG